MPEKELYLHGGQGKMSEKDTENSYKKFMTKEQWKKFHEMQDEDIDTSDIPELDKTYWSNAKIVIPPHKKAISLRVDEDILSWFKEHGKGYQSLMNAVLRSYYESQEKNKH